MLSVKQFNNFKPESSCSSFTINLLRTRKGYNWGDFTNTRTYTMARFRNSSVRKQSNCNSYLPGPMVSVSSFSMSDGCGRTDHAFFSKVQQTSLSDLRILCNGCTLLDQVPWVLWSSAMHLTAVGCYRESTCTMAPWSYTLKHCPSISLVQFMPAFAGQNKSTDCTKTLWFSCSSGMWHRHYVVVIPVDFFDVMLGCAGEYAFVFRILLTFGWPSLQCFMPYRLAIDVCSLNKSWRKTIGREKPKTSWVFMGENLKINGNQ